LIADEKSYRQFVRLFPLRRMAASLLLFLLLGDLALHVAESYLEDPPAAGSRAFVLVERGGPHDESNCPLPGHSGGRFHHHHYPGVITAHSVFTPVSLQRLVLATLVEVAGSGILVAHPGRAPPSHT
jgi:hypothetical protein